MARRQKKYLSHKKFTDRNTEEQTFTFVEQTAPLSPLFSLIGEKVKINRGGPNSKEGILLKAKTDYVALLVGQEVVYFATSHIHSVTQNIKESSSGQIEKTDGEFECAESETFTDLLSELKFQSIQINQGPESRVGKLLNVNSSMLVIFHEEDGLIYYNLEHVKFVKAILTSVNENKGNSHNSLKEYSKYDSHKNSSQVHPRYLTDGIQFEADSFIEFIQTFKHKWVSVNRTGPEALEGVLLDTCDGFFTIVNNEETFRIHPFHIKSISLGAKGSFKAEKENKDGKDSKEQSAEDSSSYEEQSSHQRESSYRESCSCEDSVLYEDSVEEVTWKPRHRTKTFDVFN